MMLILFVISMAMSAIIHPCVLKISKLKGLVDSPNARKLQKEPVPMMGGAAVFFGIVVALCFFKTVTSRIDLFSTVCAMMIMLYMGIIDDILDIKAIKKFAFEILVSILVVYGTHNLIGNFNGLFGIRYLNVAIAIPLTVIGMVGIINSINLIDGVDGLSSGMSIFIFAVFAFFLFITHEFSYCALAVTCAGALIPFFIHNVFGKKTKMYIGDGGALMIGVAISSLVIDILKRKSLNYTCNLSDADNISLIAMCLATLIVPIFDTLRVMTIRIAKGIPPFFPDRRHLHHHILDKGYSPICTTTIEILTDALCVVVWYITYRLGGGVLLQLSIVFVYVTLSFTFILKVMPNLRTTSLL